MERIVKVLTSLKSTREDLRKALKDTINILSHDISEDIRNHCISIGLLPPLLGLMRCYEDIDILLLAIQCLSTVTHGCDAVRLALANFDTIELLLSILSSSCSLKSTEWEWIPIQEQILLSLRKITFHCEPNQTTFIRLGGIGQIVKLCQLDKCNYPPDMIKRLGSLVIDKSLIASVVPVPAGEKSKMKSYFPILSLLKDVNYPVFYVDIADLNKQWITDTLILEGLALPDTELFPIPVVSHNIKWIMGRGTHVSVPNVVWLQHSVDKIPKQVNEMFHSLQLMAPPPLSCELTPPLSLGSVYAVYHKNCWVRGWMLQLPDSSGNHTFFCMDYGYSVIVSLKNVSMLPDQCCGIPPQAVPCVLVGIIPPPKSYLILENVAAILANIAFEEETNRREIKAGNGLQLLLKLIDVNDNKVRQFALSALLNLAHSPLVCETLLSLGTIPTLLELLTTTKDTVVMETSLGTLQNLLIFDSVACLEAMERLNVYNKIKEWIYPDNISNSVNRLLCTIEGLKNGLEPETSSKQENSLTCVPFPSTQKQQLVNKLPKNKHAVPIYRLLSNEQSNDCSLDTPTIMPIDRQTIKYNSKVDYHEHDNVHFYDISDVTEMFSDVSTNQILKSLCALANEQYGGTIHVGVNKRGIVNGIKLERTQKDNIRVDIDRLGQCLLPPLDNYKISFLPVVGGVCNSYVIQIKVLPSLTNVVYVIRKNKNEKCFSSLNGGTVNLSLLEVRELVASREVQKYEQLFNNDY